MTSKVSIEDLVADYESARKELLAINKKLEEVGAEKMALQHLIYARGGGHLIENNVTQTRIRVRSMAPKQLELAGSQYEIIKLSLPHGTFSANEIHDLVKNKIADITRKAVGFNLTRLAKDGFIQVITPGRGRREGIYKRT